MLSALLPAGSIPDSHIFHGLPEPERLAGFDGGGGGSCGEELGARGGKLGGGDGGCIPPHAQHAWFAVYPP